MSPIVSGGGGSGGSPTVLAVTIPLSSAQLLALFTTEVTILAAQGAGTATWPIDGFLDFKAGATPYTVPGGCNFAVSYAGVPHDFSQDILEFDAIPAMNGPSFGQAAIHLEPTVLRTTAENKALVIYAEPSNLTVGDGTAAVTVLYRVVALT